MNYESEGKVEAKEKLTSGYEGSSFIESWVNINVKISERCSYILVHFIWCWMKRSESVIDLHISKRNTTRDFQHYVRI